MGFFISGELFWVPFYSKTELSVIKCLERQYFLGAKFEIGRELSAY